MGKALHSIGAPEPPPAGIAGFRAQLQPIAGNLVSTFSLTGFEAQTYPIRFRMACPVSVDAVLGGSLKALQGPAARERMDRARSYASPLERSVPRMAELRLELAAEPAEDDAFVEEQTPAAAGWARLPFAPMEPAVPAGGLRIAALSTSAEISVLAQDTSAATHLPVVTGWAALPPAAVESMVMPASAVQPMAAPVTLLTHLATSRSAASANYLPMVVGGASFAPGAVESMLALAAAAEPVAAPTPALHIAASNLPSVIGLEPVGARESLDAPPLLATRWAAFRPVAVESMVASSAALAAMSAPAADVRLAPLVLEPASEPALAERTPLLVEAWASFAPVAVESMMMPASALEALAAPFAVSLGTAASPVISQSAFSLARPAASAPASAVASWVHFSSAAETGAAVVPALPRFEMTAAVEVAAVEEIVDVVAACETFAQAPAADPVTRMVAAAAANIEPWMEAVAAAPLAWQIAVSETFVPAVHKLVRPPAAEPAAVHVFAIDHAQPLAASPALPRCNGPVFDLALDAAPHVEGLQPAPAESMPAAAAIQPAAPVIASIISISETPVPAAVCVYGHSPAEHEPVPAESLVFPSFQAEILEPAALALPALVLESAIKLAASLQAGADASALPAAQVPTAESRPAKLQPIRALALVPPETKTESAPLEVAQHGFLNLEFHCQRPSTALSRNLEWMAPAFELTQPAFAMRLLADRVEEEAAPQKKSGNKLAMAEVFAIAKPQRKPLNPGVRSAMKAIAASVVVGGVLWFGVGTMRIGKNTPAVNRDVSMIDATPEVSSDSPAGPVAGALAAQTAKSSEPRGAIGRLRKAISERAAATVTDSFRNGMEAWGTRPKAWAAGWSRHSEGYVQPGQLALFNPSINYKDYHLEFFGQIDNKSMGWTVRSKDPKNYYAMKFTVVEPGLRPIIAMVHYPVVGGKKGRQSSTPLNVMVHNNTPFQVAVDVKGNRMVTSIDGQEVDTWIDDALPAGGVGFFAEAGEKARLYWMKVSKNEDFVGRVCAYVSSKLGDGSNTSAELQAPEMPGSHPRRGPQVPGGSEEAALAAMTGVLGGRRKLRGGVSNWRSEIWSS